MTNCPKGTGARTIHHALNGNALRGPQLDGGALGWGPVELDVERPGARMEEGLEKRG